MALGDIISKQVVVLKADASQFKAEMKSAGAVEKQVMKDRLDALEKNTAALERNGQRLQLWAAAGVAGFNLVTSSVKKYEEHLKSMGASGEAELAKLQRTTGALTKAQDSLQIAMAKVALAAAPAVLELARMADQLGRIVGGVGDLLGVADFGSALSIARQVNPIGLGGRLLWAGGSYGANNAEEWLGMGRHAAGTGSSWQSRYLPDPIFNRGGGGPISGSIDPMTQEALYRREIAPVIGSALNGFIGDLRTGWANGSQEARARGGGGGRTGPGLLERGVNQVQAFASEYARRQEYAAMIAAERDAGIEHGRLSDGSFRDYGGPIDGETRFKIAEGSADLQRFIEELEGKGKGNALERIIGPIEEFNAYAAGFGLLRDAATSAYDALVTGEMSAGQAIKKSVATGIHALGKNMLIRSLQEGAEAVSSLAKRDIPGAIAHGKSAAMFLAGSVAAGVAANALGAGGGSGAGARGGGYAAAGIGGGAPSSGPAPIQMTVVMGIGGDTPRETDQRMRRNIARARRYSLGEGVQHG